MIRSAAIATHLRIWSGTKLLMEDHAPTHLPRIGESVVFGRGTVFYKVVHVAYHYDDALGAVEVEIDVEPLGERVAPAARKVAP